MLHKCWNLIFALDLVWTLKGFFWDEMLRPLDCSDPAWFLSDSDASTRFSCKLGKAAPCSSSAVKKQTQKKKNTFHDSRLNNTPDTDAAPPPDLIENSITSVSWPFPLCLWLPDLLAGIVKVKCCFQGQKLAGICLFGLLRRLEAQTIPNLWKQSKNKQKEQLNKCIFNFESRFLCHYNG